MRNILTQLALLAVLISALSLQQKFTYAQTGDAPVTIAPNLIGEPGTTIQVPIKVVDFNSIGAISLTMLYNGAVLDLIGFTNDSGFPGLFVNQAVPGRAIAGGFNSLPNFSLPDSAVLFTLNFSYAGGFSQLAWFDDGVSCEYAGPFPDYPVLNDIPQEDFYIDGSVSQFGWISLSCPEDITTNNDEGLCSALLDFSADVFGTPQPTITYTLQGASITSPHEFPVGSSAIEVTAMNEVMTATCTFFVNVSDTEAPSLIDPAIDCSSLDQEGILTGLQEAEDFDGVELEDNVAALYQDNCGGIITATFINTIPGNNNHDQAWIFEYEYSVEDESGNIIYCFVTYSGGLVPETIYLANETIDDTRCYGASNTITLQNIHVVSGASVTLIAGKTIELFPGILVESNGHLHAYISNTYCQNPTPLVANEDQKLTMTSPEEFSEGVKESPFRIYPNPNSGVFTLELLEKNYHLPLRFAIYSLMGEMIVAKEFSGTRENIAELIYRPNGIYFLNVFYKDQIFMVKIIKN